MGFDFEGMVAAFEDVTFPSSPSSAAAPTTSLSLSPLLPHAQPFLAAMSEVALLFDHLGGGFAFVRRDITSKVALLSSFTPLITDFTSTALTEARTPKRPSPATRTLLRLMWACRFLDVLMRELADAFAADSASESGASSEDDARPRPRSITLRDAVSHAYDAALAKHHSWGVRRTVSAAVYLLPTKEVFVHKLGVDLAKRDDYLTRINASLSPLVLRMYAFYDLHELHDAV